MTIRNPLILLSITLMTFVLIGCGGDSPKTATKSTPAPKAEPATPEPVVEDGVVSLVLNGNDQMKYDKSELKAKAGTSVKLTLNHTGKLAKEVMGHNFVLLKAGTDVAAFTQKALDAKETEYIPEGDEIIAYTALVGGGESTEITFEAPEKGTYDFLCTFPGHAALMKGKFIVE
ncbi:MAG: azurin [Bacteroidota bacterium]